MSNGTSGNPAVVGLAGFGLTTLMLQFHNLGLVPEIGAVVALGLVFGGVAQLIAGLQEKSTGNNFGYCAFTSYGAFWIALSLIWVFNKTGLFVTNDNEIGWFMVAWTLFSIILWVGSLRISKAMAFTFTTLVIGFVLLDIAKFVDHSYAFWAGIDLVACALGAWYMMAAAILNPLYGRTVLPLGKPVVGE